MTAMRSSAASVPSIASSSTCFRYAFVPSRFSVKINTRRSFHVGGSPVTLLPSGGRPGQRFLRIQSTSARIFASGRSRASSAIFCMRSRSSRSRRYAEAAGCALTFRGGGDGLHLRRVIGVRFLGRVVAAIVVGVGGARKRL
jgi:hypothetical protein